MTHALSHPEIRRENLLAVLAHIEAHPETWRQTSWHCGTTHCFAGHAQVMSGCKADNATVRREARQWCGLTYYEANKLFSAYNTLDDLRQMVGEMVAEGYGAGYNRAGYDRAGYDRAGYNRAGYNRAGYDRAGYNRAGYDRAGYNRAGYNRAGYDRAGYDRDGYNRAGYNRAGYDRAGYDLAGYDRAGYDLDGLDSLNRTREQAEAEKAGAK